MKKLTQNMLPGAKTSIFKVSSPFSQRVTHFSGIFFLLLFAASGAGAQNLDVPFVPTTESVVEVMLDLADIRPGDYVIDLGSGDGRIVIAAAKRGATGHGIDIDPRRIKEARENAVNEGVADKVLFIQEDLFKTDFSKASVVTMYLLNSVNLKLRPHLLEKLRPGTRVVSHDFSMDEWEPDKFRQEGYSDIYYWVIPADANGSWGFKSGGKSFTMSVKQDFQKVAITLRSGGTSYQVSEGVLSGERIGFTATDATQNNKMVFSGRIDGDNIVGTLQVREGNEGRIEDWNARRQ